MRRSLWTALGGLASGVQSVADLEASHAGLRLYRDLCGVENPILALRAGDWTITRAVDLRDYVTPRWDESFQPPVYSASRWRRVKPVLEAYCDRLDDPQVVALRRRYRERDRETVVGEVVAARVGSGRLADPAGFGIESVCSEPDPSRAPANRTHVGFELGLPVARANLGLGFLVRSDGGDGRRWTVTGGVGWGF